MLVKLAEADLQPTEAVQTFWTATAPVGTKRADVLSPVFWTHVIRKLQPLTEVRIITLDSSWYGHYLVVYAQGMDIRIHELGYWPLEQAPSETVESDTYKVVWAGPRHLFRVVRKSDNIVVQQGFKSKNEAAVWMYKNPQRAA